MAEGFITVPPPRGEAATAQNSVGVLNEQVAANERTKQAIDVGLISNNFDKYIVRPLNAFGLGGYIFDGEGETDVNLSASITDHYTENNVAIQDHIAVKPKRVTLKTFVGELVFRRDETTETSTQKVVRKLTVLGGYLPQLSDAATQARDSFLTENSELQIPDTTFDSAVRGATDLYSLVKNLNPPIKRQEQAYMFFKALMEQKILMSVQTPFEFMNNMAIESISAKQNELTQDMSEFTISLKEIRFATTETVAFDAEAYQERAGQQAEEVAKQGKTEGVKPNESYLYTITTGDKKADNLLRSDEFADLRVTKTGN